MQYSLQELVYLRDYKLKALLNPTSNNVCQLQIIAVTKLGKKLVFITHFKLFYELRLKQ